jgi:hypothetical protein
MPSRGTIDHALIIPCDSEKLLWEYITLIYNQGHDGIVPLRDRQITKIIMGY